MISLKKIKTEVIFSNNRWCADRPNVKNTIGSTSETSDFSLLQIFLSQTRETRRRLCHARLSQHFSKLFYTLLCIWSEFLSSCLCLPRLRDNHFPMRALYITSSRDSDNHLSHFLRKPKKLIIILHDFLRCFSHKSLTQKTCNFSFLCLLVDCFSSRNLLYFHCERRNDWSFLKQRFQFPSVGDANDPLIFRNEDFDTWRIESKASFKTSASLDCQLLTTLDERMREITFYSGVIYW
jgi:hypothetical protein